MFQINEGIAMSVLDQGAVLRVLGHLYNVKGFYNAVILFLDNNKKTIINKKQENDIKLLQIITVSYFSKAYNVCIIGTYIKSRSPNNRKSLNLIFFLRGFTLNIFSTVLN